MKLLSTVSTIICFLPFTFSFIPSSSSIPKSCHKSLQQISPGGPFRIQQYPQSYPNPSAASPPSLSLIAIPDGVQEAWTAYNDALVAQPLLVKSVTACVILGAADLAGQALEDYNSGENTEIDYARTARFAFFGLVLQAPWNHVYYQILDNALPPTPEPWTATTAIKTVIDQFIQAPIFTVLIFAFLGLLEGKTVGSIQKQLEDDYQDTMIANWKLWVPATVVNIAFVPPILRVLYLNVVFFFWSIFLSLKLNNNKDEKTDSVV